MKVMEKATWIIREVYDITYDNTGYPRFLIYDDDGTWVRRSAKHFVPVNVPQDVICHMCTKQTGI